MQTRRLLIIVAVLSSPLLGSAQDPYSAPAWLWAAPMINACSVACPSSNVLTIDNAGHVYLMAAFRGSVDFGSTNVASAEGGSGMFLAKFNPAGQLIWVTQFGEAVGGLIGDGWEGRAALALDSTGNIYAAGVLTGPAIPRHVAVVVGFDAQGQVRWVWRSDGAVGHCKAVVVDTNDCLLVAGHVEGTMDFSLDPDGECPGLELTGEGDGFVAKFDANGQGIWFQHIEGYWGASGDWVDVNGLALDASGAVYATGQIANGATFRSSTSSFQTNFVSQGSSDIFLAKYSASGSLLWLVQAGSAMDGGDADAPYDEAFDVAVDAVGHVYITGGFGRPSADFGGTILTTDIPQEFFLAKYDADGRLLWAVDSNDGSGKGTALRVDAAGDVHVLSHPLFGGPLQLKKFDPTGLNLWAQPQDPSSFFQTYGLGPDGSVNMGGQFSNEIILGGNSLFTASGMRGFYIARSDSAGSGPRLAIESGEEHITLSWPVAAVGYELHGGETLDSASWLPVTVASTTNAALKQVTLPRSPASQFFQLRK